MPSVYKRLLLTSATLSLVVLASTTMLSSTNTAHAFSELQPSQSIQTQSSGNSSNATDDAESAEETGVVNGDSISSGIPMPDPLVNPDAGNSGKTTSESIPAIAENAEIYQDLTKAPQVVQRLRELIIEAAKTGDIEKLRPLITNGSKPATGAEDPIQALKDYSGDANGQEILAIILDLLDTGYAHLDAGTPEEVYVWPYFVGKTLPSLTPQERVELLRIITAGDLADMEEYGNYSFYRIGITPQGEWKFFTAGD